MMYIIDNMQDTHKTVEKHTHFGVFFVFCVEKKMMTGMAGCMIGV